MTVPATSNANPLCPVIPPRPFNSVAINILPALPDLSLSQTPSATTYVTGQPETIGFEVTSASGHADATSVVLTDTLPFVFPSANVSLSGTGAPSCSLSSQVLTCVIGALTAGDGFSVTVDVSPATNWWLHRPQVSCATVTLAQPDANPADNADCVDFTVQCANDQDCDGYTDALESALGESPSLFCGTMRADINNDGTVNGLDLGALARSFGQTVTGGTLRVDQDGDGWINGLDLARLAPLFTHQVQECT